jgi:hypothetical protein
MGVVGFQMIVSTILIKVKVTLKKREGKQFIDYLI